MALGGTWPASWSSVLPDGSKMLGYVMPCARRNASGAAGAKSRVLIPTNCASALVATLAACRSLASARQGGHQEPQTLITRTLPA